MRARKLIGEATFEPERLSMITRVFDEAWEAVAGCFANDPHTVEMKRFALASLILELARDAQLGPEQLKLTATRIIREQYAKSGQQA